MVAIFFFKLLYPINKAFEKKNVTLIYLRKLYEFILKVSFPPRNKNNEFKEISY